METVEAVMQINHRNHTWCIPVMVDIDYILTSHQTMTDPEAYEIQINGVDCIGNSTQIRDYDLLGQLVFDNFEIHGPSIVELI